MAFGRLHCTRRGGEFTSRRLHPAATRPSPISLASFFWCWMVAVVSDYVGLIASSSDGMTTCDEFLPKSCSGQGNLNTVHPSRTFASNNDYCLSATSEKGRIGCILEQIHEVRIRLDGHASRRQAGCRHFTSNPTELTFLHQRCERASDLSQTYLRSPSSSLVNGSESHIYLYRL
jgi:hypothetical protein